MPRPNTRQAMTGRGCTHGRVGFVRWIGIEAGPGGNPVQDLSARSMGLGDLGEYKEFLGYIREAKAVALVSPHSLE